MIQQSFIVAERIFKENNGMLRTGQAKKLGIHEPTLIKMCDEGLLSRESRGLYRLAELPLLSNPDLVKVAIRVPESVISLISGLCNPFSVEWVR